MPISEKLAFEIYFILLVHIFAIVILSSFCFYIFLKAKKRPVLYSFLSVAGMLLIWMISKVLKTVSPNVHIRWLFIVTQYVGIQYIGFFLVLFAYIYTRNKVPSKKFIILTAIPPTIAFLFVLTNPAHMLFYSYYDFYRDSFGIAFMPSQAIQYIYIAVGIFILSRGYTASAFGGQIIWARFFASATVLPLIGNLYYIVFKLGDIPWIFPFPVFDYSPIAGSISLMMFTIPALRFKFFDISDVSFQHIFADIPVGIVFCSPRNNLFSPNKAFLKMFCKKSQMTTLSNLLERFNSLDTTSVANFFLDDSNKSFFCETKNGCSYSVKQFYISKNVRVFSFLDVTEIIKLEQTLNAKNYSLKEINLKLVKMSETSAELSAARIKSAIAQNIHDILGHSITVALCTSELALKDTSVTQAASKLEIINSILSESVDDLKNSVYGSVSASQTSLTKAILRLQNPSINLEFVSQGNSYELNTALTETIFRICQESVTNAIKHGKASQINIFLRFYPTKVELYIIDNGIGCKKIVKNYGLTGMESRVKELSGEISFGSDGNKGFHVYVSFDINSEL